MIFDSGSEKLAFSVMKEENFVPPQDGHLITTSVISLLQTAQKTDFVIFDTVLSGGHIIVKQYPCVIEVLFTYLYRAYLFSL